MKRTLVAALLALPVGLWAQEAWCIESLPWAEDFNSTPQDSLPDGWVAVEQSSYGTATYPSVTSNELRMRRGDSNSTVMVATPCFDVEDAYVHITFRVRRFALNYSTVALGYVSDTLPGTDFDTLWSDVTASDWRTIDLYVEAPAPGFRLAILTEGNFASSGAIVDDVLVESQPCLPPQVQPEAVEVEPHSVTLRWPSVQDDNMGQYVVGLRPVGGDWTYLPATTDTMLTVDGLSPDISYEFCLGIECEYDTVFSTLAPLALTTPCGPYPLPFFNDFSTPINACWSASGVSRANWWGTGGWYYSFNNAHSSLRTPVIDAPVDQWAITVGYCGRTSASWGFLAVGVLDAADSLIAVSDTLRGNSGNFYSHTETLYRTYRFDSLDNEECRLVIYGSGVNIYSVQIVGNSCTPVDTLWVDSATDHSLAIGWEGWTFANGYRVVYGAGETTDTLVTDHTDQTSCTLAGLDPMTTYSVQVFPICDDDMTSAHSPTLHARTLRGDVVLPYLDGFEQCEPGLGPDAWPVLAGHTVGGVVYPAVVQSTSAHEGDHLLVFRAAGADYNLIATPLLPASPQGFDISFQARGVGTFEVGTVDTTLDPASFVVAESYSHNTSFSNVWYRRELHLGDSSTQHIAFRVVAYSTTFALDELEVHAHGQCPAPQLLAVEATAHSLTLHRDTINPGPWQLCFGTEEDLATADTLTLGTVDSLRLPNLTPNTHYYLWMRSVCGAADTSAWNWLGAYRTECLPMAIPYTELFDSVPSGQRHPDCWHAQPDSIFSTIWERRVQVTSGGAYGSKALRLQSDGPGVYAATDYVPLPPDSIGVAFMAYNEAVWYASNLRAGIMTDPDNPATFVALLDTAVPGDGWHEYSFNTFGLSIEGPVCVAFSLSRGEMRIDNLRIDSVGAPGPQDDTVGISVATVDGPWPTLRPNPASMQMTIDLGAEREAQVEMMDVNGRVVMQTRCNARLTVVDLGRVPEGLYIVRVAMPEGVAVRRLVVAR